MNAKKEIHSIRDWTRRSTVLVALVASSILGPLGSVIASIAVVGLLITTSIAIFLSFRYRSKTPGAYTHLERELGTIRIQSAGAIVSDLLDESQNFTVSLPGGNYTVSAQFRKYDNEKVAEIERLIVRHDSRSDLRKSPTNEFLSESGQVLVGDKERLDESDKKQIRKDVKDLERGFQGDTTFFGFLSKHHLDTWAVVSDFPDGAGGYEYLILEDEIGVVGLEFKMVAGEN